MTKHIIMVAAFFLILAGSASADDTKVLAPLYFREDWKEITAETPITQDHVHNSNLVMALHGPGKNMIKKSHHDKPLDDPYYVWSGQCEGTWAVTLTKRGTLADLTYGRVRWRTKNFDRSLKVVLGCDDGSWLIGTRGTGETPGWQEFTINLSDIRWQELNIDTVSAGDNVENPDLTRVRSIGFTDLEKGGQSTSCSRLDWIEVYGRKVER